MKQLSEEAVALLKGRRPIVAGAAKFVFGDDAHTYRYWSASHPLPGDLIGETGKHFLPISDRGLITPRSSSIGSTSDGLTISLSGLDPDLAAAFENEDYHQKPVTIWRLVFSDPNTLVAAMVWIRGRVDYATHRHRIGGKASLEIQVEGPRSDMSRAGARIAADSDQRVLGGVGDASLKHIGVVARKTLAWGQKPATVKNATGGLAAAKLAVLRAVGGG